MGTAPGKHNLACGVNYPRVYRRYAESCGPFIYPIHLGVTAAVPTPTVFADLLRRIASRFDTTNPGEAWGRLTNFGLLNVTSFNVYQRSFRLLTLSISGSP